MKRSKLLNSNISHIIAKAGHFDGLTVCDAGLPIPEGVQRIDIAVSEGVPSFMDTVKAVTSELEIESVELAEEFKTISPKLHKKFVSYLEKLATERRKSISIEYVPHEIFKANTEQSKAIVRTGEFTPYANVTFKSGVVF